MNKTLRIFQKDTLHLWPEIVLSLALTFGFALTGHYAWPQYRSYVRESGSIVTWTIVLMFLSWWFLIARAVHDEPLVGDRQFWITRPYGWPRVLAAKWLFIAAYIVLPLLLAQCFLLHQAGLRPFAVIPGLLCGAALFIGFFILPLLALATVTPGITKMFIILFGLVVYAGVAAYIASLVGTSAPWVPQVTHPIAAAAFAIPVIAVVVMFVQYARRNTRLSTAALLGLVVLVTTAALVADYKSGSLRDFPSIAAGEQSPVFVAFNPDPKYTFDLATNPNVARALKGEGSDDAAEVPLTLAGIASGHAITFEGQMLTLSADGVPTETVEWHRGSHSPFLSRSGSIRLRSNAPVVGDSSDAITIPLRFINEYAGKQVTIHITYAANELEAEAPTAAIFNGHTADVPQNGHCVNLADYPADEGGLMCQYPVSDPSFTHVEWKTHTNCGDSSSATSNRNTWIGDTERSFVGLSIDPVVSSAPVIGIKDVVDHPPSVHYLCPNTPLTFTRYHVLRRRLIQVTLPPIDLRLYVTPPEKEGAAVAFRPAFRY